MEYLNSGDIGVFPATRRSANYQLKSRRFTEESVTRLTNMVVDKSYVITEEFDANEPFEFVIKGYYFKVSTGKALLDLNLGDTVYATLKKYNGGSFDEINGDSGTIYKGVEFSSSPDDTDLPLLVSGSIPTASRVRFSDTVLGITEIDGGIIK